MVLVRNDASGFSPAWIDTVRVRTVSLEAALAGYRAGAFDVLVDVPPAQVRAARQRQGTHVVALVGSSYLFGRGICATRASPIPPSGAPRRRPSTSMP
jgi:hypothetical protein